MLSSLIVANKYLFYLKLEKHKVILHELSFEDHHRLKAPELLCPVFLAVQDDSDNESGDETGKKNQRMSQSIDDLCEMISEDSDDDDQGT